MPAHSPSSLFNQNKQLGTAQRLRLALSAYEAALKKAPSPSALFENREDLLKLRKEQLAQLKGPLAKNLYAENLELAVRVVEHLTQFKKKVGLKVNDPAAYLLHKIDFHEVLTLREEERLKRQAKQFIAGLTRLHQKGDDLAFSLLSARNLRVDVKHQDLPLFERTLNHCDKIGDLGQPEHLRQQSLNPKSLSQLLEDLRQIIHKKINSRKWREFAASLFLGLGMALALVGAVSLLTPLGLPLMLAGESLLLLSEPLWFWNSFSKGSRFYSKVEEVCGNTQKLLAQVSSLQKSEEKPALKEEKLALKRKPSLTIRLDSPQTRRSPR